MNEEYIEEFAEVIANGQFIKIPMMPRNQALMLTDIEHCTKNIARGESAFHVELVKGYALIREYAVGNWEKINRCVFAEKLLALILEAAKRSKTDPIHNQEEFIGYWQWLLKDYEENAKYCHHEKFVEKQRSLLHSYKVLQAVWSKR